MGGHFDVARPRLVQTEPASDERDHPRCGQVDEYIYVEGIPILWVRRAVVKFPVPT